MLAREYRFRKADSLKLNVDEAMGMAKSLNYKKGLALSLIRLGDYYSDIEENSKALEIYNEAKAKTIEIKEPELIVEALKSIGLYHSILKNDREAIIAYYEAIEIARKNGLLDAEARMRHNLGFIYGNQKLNEEAIAEYKIADSIWSKLDNKVLQGATISNMALNAINNGDLDAALPYIEESLRILKSDESPLWYSRAARCKARYFLGKNSLDSTLQWIAIADEPLKTVFNPRDKLEIYMLYGSTYLKKGDIPQAEANLNSALKATIEFKDIRNQVIIFGELARLEEMKGNITSAYANARKSDSIRTLSEMELKTQNIGLLRAKLDFQNEKEKLKLQNEYEAGQQRKYIFLSLTALLVLFLFYLQMGKSNAQKKKLNETLKANSQILQEKQLILEENNKTKDVLFSVIGHDLKGPIDSLHGLLDICLQENENGEQIFQKFGPSIKTKVENVQSTLGNLLNWGKQLVAGQTTVKTNVLISEVGKKVEVMFEEKIKEKNIVFMNQLPEGHTVFVDKEHLNIKLRNLVGNALKFTPNGGTIEVCIHSKGNTDEISVKDSGIGMHQETLDSIMQGKNPESTFGTQLETGTGLGLLLVKELIEKNEGKLNIESRPGEGSVFTILLKKMMPEI